VFNPYQPKPAKIVTITPQTDNIKLFRFDVGKKFDFMPGQIIELSVPGFGEAPFAPCNQPADNLELCVRVAGKLTSKLHSLKVGDKVALRGPFGNGWPVADAQVKSEEKKNLLIVVGGLGLIPLRTLILGKDKFLGRDAIVQIFYGAKSPEEFLFKNEFDDWRKAGIDLQLTIDKECSGWNTCVGLVTVLFDQRTVVGDAKAFLCGPPVMYKGALQKVKDKKFNDKDIYLSLERRMHCGVGVCQHCAVGSYYTCKHGPVFRYDKIKDIQGAI